MSYEKAVLGKLVPGIFLFLNRLLSLDNTTEFINQH